MPDHDLVTESVLTLADAWASFNRHIPSGRIDRLDGATVYWAGVPLPFLNICLVDSPCADRADLRRRLETILAHVDGEEHPWLGCLCNDWVPADWREVVADVGLHVAMPMTGMVAEALAPPRRPPPRLDLRRAGDEASRRAVAELNNAAYGLPDGMCDCVAEAGFWSEDMHGYVGSVGGEDVCTTTVLPAAGTLYVALVATKPGHGRQGYADHVMRHALERGGSALGLRRSILHATEAGRPVYAAMGYRDVARFALLSTTPPEQH